MGALRENLKKICKKVISLCSAGCGITKFNRLSIYIFLGVVAFVFLLPLFYMVSTSLKDLPQIHKSPPNYLPKPVYFESFTSKLRSYVPFPLYMKNSFTIAILAMVGDVFSASFVAYGFARLKFPLRDTLFGILLGTMMIPFYVKMIPLFIIFRKLGWINTFLPLIVPSYLGTPLFIFLMRQVFLTFPEELVDAARIDGASEFSIWMRIFLPLSKPALAAVAILSFQLHWNKFIEPLIFLQSPQKRTAVLGLYSLLTPQDVIEWNVVMASTVVLILPVVFVFFMFQRAFIEGIRVTGMRG